MYSYLKKYSFEICENKILNLILMKRKNFSLGVASIITIFLCAIPVGYKMVLSCKNHNSQVEYASETNDKFYQKMVKMERNSTLTFNGFPTCLTSILSHNTAPGDAILTTEKDTLYLAFKWLNYADINKYPFYIVKDNKDNFWSLYRHNEKFLLTRRDKKDFKDLLTKAKDLNKAQVK